KHELHGNTLNTRAPHLVTQPSSGTRYTEANFPPPRHNCRRSSVNLPPHYTRFVLWLCKKRQQK
ncbi:hypothetical protein J6590_047410, partial [Homalodisca vitripennis]